MAQYLIELFSNYYTWGYIGFFVGSALGLRNLVRNGLPFPMAVIGLTLSAYGGLFGTRILFLLEYDPSLLLSHWTEGMVFWQGGLSWMGGPILGTAVGGLFLWVWRKPILPNLGAYMPGLALAHAIARISCIIRGCCYGAPTTLPWAMYSDVLQTRVHPTQVYDMVCEVATAVVLQMLFRSPSKRRYLLPLYLLLSASHRFVTEGFRGTPSGPALIPGLRFYQSVSVALIGLALVWLIVLWKRRYGLIAGGGLAGATAVSVLILALTRGLAGGVSEPAEKNPNGHYLVVTRKGFEEVLRPWIEWRTRQGWTVDVKSFEQPPRKADIKQWIVTHSGSDERVVLLVGDAAPGDASREWWYLPVGSENSGSDAYYGDRNGDGIVDLAVGRWPVRDLAQVRLMTSKAQEYERRFRSLPAKESPRLLLWLGVPRFESVVDAMSVAVRSIVPDRFGLTVIADQPARKQPDLFLESLAHPYALSAIISHGYHDCVATALTDTGPVVLTTDSLRALASGQPNGPLAVFACETGQFASEKEKPCLAEALMLHPGGPVAVVASGQKNNPMVNYLLARELASHLVEGRTPLTVGELFLCLQRTLDSKDVMGMSAQDPVGQQILGLLLPEETSELSQTRALQGQVLAYSLLGDPGTPLFLGSPGVEGQRR